MKNELENANRCKRCNKIMTGLTSCNCEQSQKQFELWDKAERKKQRQLKNENQ